MNDPHRRTDPEDADFRNLRIPKRWKTILMVIAATGTFVGSFIVTLNRVEKDDHKVSSAQMEKLSSIESQLDDLSESIGGVIGDQQAILKQVREMKKSLQAILKDEGAMVRQERLDEIVVMLKDIDKRVGKKR